LEQKQFFHDDFTMSDYQLQNSQKHSGISIVITARFSSINFLQKEVAQYGRKSPLLKTFEII